MSQNQFCCEHLVKQSAALKTQGVESRLWAKAQFFHTKFHCLGSCFRVLQCCRRKRIEPRRVFLNIVFMNPEICPMGTGYRLFRIERFLNTRCVGDMTNTSTPLRSILLPPSEFAHSISGSFWLSSKSDHL